MLKRKCAKLYCCWSSFGFEGNLPCKNYDVMKRNPINLFSVSMSWMVLRSLFKWRCEENPNDVWPFRFLSYHWNPSAFFFTLFIYKISFLYYKALALLSCMYQTSNDISNLLKWLIFFLMVQFIISSAYCFTDNPKL